jgi:hypothetical protein
MATGPWAAAFGRLSHPSSVGYHMYPLPARKHDLSAERLYALEVLADAGLWGCTAAMLLAYGCPVSMLANLVRDGLATARRETLRMGNRQIRAPRIWITDAGHRALAEAVYPRTAIRRSD